MRKVRLGNTNIEVSNMCLGTMYFGSKVDEATSFKLLDMYVEAGGSYLDTANNYAHWIKGCNGDESEIILGKWMKERNNRSDMFLATKCGARPFVPGQVDDVEGNSREAIFSAIEDSLQRLQTDYIDLYYIHVDWRREPIEETMEALHELVVSGKVKYLGCSNIKTWRIAKANAYAKANGLTPFVAVQNWYSYLQPRANADMWVHEFADDELFDYCQTEKDVSLMAYSTTLSGAYNWDTIYDHNEPAIANRFFSEDNERRFKTIKDMATKKGTTVYQILLAWMMNHEPSVVPILGVSRESQLQGNLESLNLVLSDDEMNQLNKAGFNGKTYIDSDPAYKNK